MTTRRGTGSRGAAAAGPRILEGQGLSVRRRPLDPGRPINYASLSTCALVEGVSPDRGYKAVTALSRSVDAARSAYEERSAQLESAVPRFAFELLEALFDRESVLAVEPGREAVARALALDESYLPAVARLSPGDADTIADIAELSPSRPLTVVADPTVEPGGAMVEIGSTTIDSQLSRALERVRAVIVGHTEEDPR